MKILKTWKTSHHWMPTSAWKQLTIAEQWGCPLRVGWALLFLVPALPRCPPLVHSTIYVTCMAHISSHFFFFNLYTYCSVTLFFHLKTSQGHPAMQICTDIAYPFFKKKSMHEFWAELGLLAVLGLFSSFTVCCGVWASHRGSFSCGSQAQEYGLSSYETWA